MNVRNIKMIVYLIVFLSFFNFILILVILVCNVIFIKYNDLFIVMFINDSTKFETYQVKL